MTNNIKKLLAAGKPVMNGWLIIPSGYSAELMAPEAWSKRCAKSPDASPDGPGAPQAGRVCNDHALNRCLNTQSLHL